MAEALALSVFGPGDFNHSLEFSNRESLGKVFGRRPSQFIVLHAFCMPFSVRKLKVNVALGYPFTSMFCEYVGYTPILSLI